MENENQTVALARTGDRKAFEMLYKEHHGPVYRVVCGIVGNAADAEDLTQQAWIKVWDKISTFRGDSSFKTWLFRLAKNTAWDHLRKKRRLRDIFSDLIAGGEDGVTAVTNITPRRVAEAVERDERFRAALAELPLKQRTTFTLREVEGLSYHEIAEVMGCREGTVMSRLHQARQTLSAWLSNDI